MRFAILLKTTASSEAGEMPGEESLAEVVAYHEELARAGALYHASGFHPTREAWRIRYFRGTRTVVDGPFEESDEQVAGYTIIDVASREEAMGWAMRFPRPTNREDEEGEIEIRQLFELKDFVQGPAIERFAIERFRKRRRSSSRTSRARWN